MSAENLPAAAGRVRDALAAAGHPCEIHDLPASTRTAPEAAAAVGAEVGQIVKSLVFTAAGKPVIALVSGSNRLSEGRLAHVAGKPVRRPDAAQVRQMTGYAIGGIPPLGHVAPLPTYLDRDLLQYDVVWAAAGTHNHVFPIAPADLVAATGASVLQLAEASGQKHG